MPWPKDRKKETQQKIVEAAAAAFRERGVAAVSVGEVMERAGLTHGGFYAHFKSKDDLVSKALAYASEQTAQMLSSAQKEQTANALLSEAQLYLSEGHALHPELGCPVAAIGTELLRSGERVRRTFSSEVSKRISHLREIAGGGSQRVRNRRAAGAFACMAGGLMIARALKEPERSEFLQDCRAFLDEALETPA